MLDQIFEMIMSAFVPLTALLMLILNWNTHDKKPAPPFTIHVKIDK